MSVDSAILSLSLLLAVFGAAIVWLITKVISVRKALTAEQLAHADTAQTLAIAQARINTLEKVGYEMFLELQSKAYREGYLSYVPLR